MPRTFRIDELVLFHAAACVWVQYGLVFRWTTRPVPRMRGCGSTRPGMRPRGLFCGVMSAPEDEQDADQRGEVVLRGLAAYDADRLAHVGTLPCLRAGQVARLRVEHPQ